MSTVALIALNGFCVYLAADTALSAMRRGASKSWIAIGIALCIANLVCLVLNVNILMGR